ncbi:MAG: ABC transporter permease subunit [Micromonosporaceae bacterium]|nr:ABC transporter permease subunit [Micromonosporaceae bacterium]
MTQLLTRPTSRPRYVARGILGWHWGMLALALVLAVLIVGPLGFVTGRAVLGGELTTKVQEFVDFMSQPATLRALRNTFLIAVPATLIACAGGVALGWLLARTDIPGRRLLNSMPLIPILIPRVSAAIGWVFLLSPRQGILNVFYRDVFGSDAETGPFNAHSFLVIIFVMGINLVPYAYALMYPSFTQMNSELEEAGLASGASELRVAWRVTLPAMRPALLGSLSLCFMLAIAQFSIPYILGSPERITVLTTELFGLLTTFPANYDAVAYLGIVLGLFAVILLYGHRRLTALRSFVTVTGKGHSDRLVRLRRWKPAALAFVWLYAGLTVILPVGALVVASLLSFWGADYRLDEMGLDWYRSLFDHAWAMPALGNSLRLALVGSLCCIVLAALASWYGVRRKGRLNSVLQGLAELPIGIPSSVFGIGFLFAFIALWADGLNTSFPLLVMYSVLFLPFAMRSVTSALHQVSPELEEAAYVSGASRFGAFRRVTLPLLKNGMFYGWLLVLAILFRELEATVFLVTPGTPVFASALLDMWGLARWPQAAAYSVLVLLLTLVLLGAMSGLLGIGKRAGSGRRRPFPSNRPGSVHGGV